MSSIMYGRYTAMEAGAAAVGGSPKVVVQRADGTQLSEIPATAASGSVPKPKSLDFAGVAGDKVLALLPAEALALYTVVLDPAKTNDFFNLTLGEWFALLLVAAPAFFVIGRVSAGTYRLLLQHLAHGKPSGIAICALCIGEVLRFVVPAIALTSWLMAGEADMVQAASLPDWGWLSWTQTDKIEMKGWGLILFVVATLFAWIANRIGFNAAPMTTDEAGRAAAGNQPAGPS